MRPTEVHHGLSVWESRAFVLGKNRNTMVAATTDGKNRTCRQRSVWTVCCGRPDLGEKWPMRHEAKNSNA